MLDDLPGDVQGQVRAVHHALHEAQVGRQQLLAVVHDLHAVDVELGPDLRLGELQVEALVPGDVEQGLEVQHAFGGVVDHLDRVVEGARDLPVEGVVLLGRDVGLAAQPEGLAGIEGLLVDALVLALGLLHVHEDGVLDEVGELLDDGAQPPGLQEFLLLGFRCRVTSVPRSGLPAGSTVNSPRPSDSQRTAWAAPAARETTVTLSATMNAE